MNKKLIQQAYDSIYPTWEQRDRMLNRIVSAAPTQKKDKTTYTAVPQEPQGWKLMPVLAALLLLICGMGAFGYYNQDITPAMTDAPATEPVETESAALREFMESDFYKANIEWYDQLQRWNDVENEGADYPYNLYGCRNSEMEAELKAILDTYGLELSDAIDEGGTDSFDYFLESLGIQSVLGGDEGVTYETDSCFWAKDGTFDYGGTTTMSYEGTPWTDPVYYSFHTASKQKLDYIFMDLGHLEDYECWEYTTENGESLILAQNSVRSLIILDTEDTVVHISIGRYPGGQYVSDEKPLTREALEAFAETFDFSPLT